MDPPRHITHPPKDNRWFKAFRRDPTRKAIRELAAKQQPEVPRPGEKRTVFVAVMARMVVTPLLLLPMIALFAWHDTFESVRISARHHRSLLLVLTLKLQPVTSSLRAAEDPVFILTAVLIISSPPAITLAQITQAASGDAFERLISKTIWVSYAVLVPPRKSPIYLTSRAQALTDPLCLVGSSLVTLLYVVLGLFLSRL